MSRGDEDQGRWLLFRSRGVVKLARVGSKVRRAQLFMAEGGVKGKAKKCRSYAPPHRAQPHQAQGDEPMPQWNQFTEETRAPTWIAAVEVKQRVAQGQHAETGHECAQIGSLSRAPQRPQAEHEQRLKVGNVQAMPVQAVQSIEQAPQGGKACSA